MRMFAVLLLLLLLVPVGFSPQVQAQQSQSVIRAQVNLVNVLFSAFDKKGQHIRGLSKNDIEIYEDDIKQNTEFFRFEGGEEAEPLTIVLLMDTSGSVKDKLDLEQTIATDFFREALRPKKDLAAVMEFDSEVTLVQDFTDDVGRLDTALKTLKAGGGTSLYDAVYLASEDKLKPEAGRKVILIVSDGDDTTSKLKRKQAIEAAQKNDVTVFAIGVKSPMFRADFGALDDLARETGGRSFTARIDMREITTAFQSILGILKQQYNVSYYSTNPKRDGGFRRIAIRVKKSNVRVQHRSGYYAPRS